jgi:uncharacterized membrane protein YtjA (UPF0391 family)
MVSDPSSKEGALERKRQLKIIGQMLVWEVVFWVAYAAFDACGISGTAILVAAVAVNVAVIIALVVYMLVSRPNDDRPQG